VQTPTLNTNGHIGESALAVVDCEFHEPAHLTQAEAQHLFELELTIRNDLINFLKVGEALAQVRDLRLYRQDYLTFGAYTSQRWGFGRAHAYRLMQVSQVAKALDPCSDDSPPTHETQLRPLIGLEPQKAKEVWELAITRAKGGAITEAIVKKAVKELTPRRVADAKPRRPRWSTVSKEAKSLLLQALATEKSMRTGIGNDAGLKFMSDIQRFLEALAKIPKTNE